MNAPRSSLHPDWQALAELATDLEAGRRADLAGIWGAARSLALAELALRTERQLWAVAATPGAAERVRRDLALFLDERRSGPPRSGKRRGRYLQRRALGEPALLLPPPCDSPYAYEALPDADRRQRLRALHQLLEEEPAIVVTSVDALLARATSPAAFRGRGRRLTVGQELTREGLVAFLERAGYRRVEQVTAPGEYRMRGGLADVFSPVAPLPVRIELGADRIESLREFDPDTQRSVTQIQEMVAGPAEEAPGLADLAASARLQLAAMTGRGEIGRAAARDLAARFDAGVGISLDQRWYFSSDLAPAWSWIPDGAAVILLGADEIRQAARRYAALAEREFTERTAAGEPAPPPPALYERSEALLAELAGRPGGAWEPLAVAGAARTLEVASVPAYNGNVRSLARDLLDTTDAGGAVWLVARTEVSASRLRDVLSETHVAELLDGHSKAGPNLARLQFLIGDLSSGFRIAEIGLTVLAESDLFGERLPRRRQAAGEAASGLSLRDLALGDLVVHADHGVGEYAGLVRLAVDGIERDLMLIRYAPPGKLYVPIDHIHRVQKYVAPGGRRPALDRMGSQTWGKTKAKAKESAYQYAAELLKIYAARHVACGHAFASDTHWQKEFELGFPYDETPDQLRAISDVKMDLESSRPMDRLVCGDVGYGKTEVAMRAAFKVADGGRQVAVLAPTTVLAQQHYETFRRRFRPFPMEVGVMSRFLSPAEQRETARRITEGKVDVVIGTHRLFSSDVRFDKLGLLIVDEEQRFGVRHKEQLKKLRASVDVLTLTATPIPRTLQMSLFGIRDISLINTAPEDRLPIRTRMAKFNPELIRDAVRAELDRGGQVYVVHNRVRSIYSLARLVQRLAPDARVVVAHGQMPEDELERVMGDFARRRYDVLVATTIIESGLDIPTVNTIVVNRADAFGLAQLYQLRGRVGRDRFQAHALLLVPGLNAITPEARKRLLALQRLTALGSGYRIAMEDLEIRGAGEILGARQSGHVAAVGFHMYAQLMEQAVHELRGEPVDAEFEVDLKVQAEAGLPPEYVPEAAERVDFYRRLALARNRFELAALSDELADRYGELPPPAAVLTALHRLRLECQRLRIDKGRVRSDGASLHFATDTPVDPGAVSALLQREPGRFRLDPLSATLAVRAAWPDPEAGLAELARQLSEL